LLPKPNPRSMVKNSLELRRKKYFKLSSQIAQLDNTQLLSLFDASELSTSNSGWGTNHTIIIGESKVFVKSVPVTNLEYNNLLSTKNLYHLPTYFNYGIRSTGFGVFRELITYIKTTNWVLDGAVATFPLMYHYRIIPFSGQRADVDSDVIKDYGEVLRNLGHLIRPFYYSCSEPDKRRIMEKYDIKEGLKPYQVGSLLLDNIEQIHADEDIKLDDFYVACIVKYRSIIALMQEFFVDMSGNKKDTKFPYAKLRLLLEEAGLIADAGFHDG
jgi:hypothetical protein